MSASPPPPPLWKILRFSRLWWSDSHHWPRWPSTLVSSEKPSSSLRAVAGWLSSKKAGINEHQKLEMEDTIPLAFHPLSPDPQNDVDSGKEREREAEKDGERKHPFINMKKQESLLCLQTNPASHVLWSTQWFCVCRRWEWRWGVPSQEVENWPAASQQVPAGLKSIEGDVFPGNKTYQGLFSPSSQSGRSVP